jgi:hypothetical protein
VWPFDYKNAHRPIKIYHLPFELQFWKWLNFWELGSLTCPPPDPSFAGVGKHCKVTTVSLLATSPGTYKEPWYFISTKKLNQPTAKVIEFVHLAWKGELIRINQS